ncbi:MAG TPA: hypothetical protein VK789_30795 [Bryobacteraceae bacterium]|nr:hypothetical protein [Bryobacteraceae bacterium]
MNSNKSMADGNSSESRLDELFLAYRQACPDPEAAPNFMPELWAKIEAREASTNWFGRVAKALVTAALAATVILGMMISSANKPNAFFNATFVDAVQADQMAGLEPLHIDRLAQLEQQ